MAAEAGTLPTRVWPHPPSLQCGWDAQRPRSVGSGVIREERQAAVEMPLRPAVLCTAMVDPEDAAWVEAASLSAAEPCTGLRVALHAPWPSFTRTRCSSLRFPVPSMPSRSRSLAQVHMEQGSSEDGYGQAGGGNPTVREPGLFGMPLLLSQAPRFARTAPPAGARSPGTSACAFGGACGTVT